MGGSSPSVFHTAPPQPASNARLTLYALSVGGAEASQNGLGDSMPRNLVLRSATCLPPRLRAQEFVDRDRRDLAVLHCGHREVFAAGHAVAARPDAGQRGAPLLVDADAVLLELEQLRAVAELVPEHLLADR